MAKRIPTVTNNTNKRQRKGFDGRNQQVPDYGGCPNLEHSRLCQCGHNTRLNVFYDPCSVRGLTGLKDAEYFKRISKLDISEHCLNDLLTEQGFDLTKLPSATIGDEYANYIAKYTQEAYAPHSNGYNLDSLFKKVANSDPFVSVTISDAEIEEFEQQVKREVTELQFVDGPKNSSIGIDDYYIAKLDFAESARKCQLTNHEPALERHIIPLLAFGCTFFNSNRKEPFDGSISDWILKDSLSNPSSFIPTSRCVHKPSLTKDVPYLASSFTRMYRKVRPPKHIRERIKKEKRKILIDRLRMRLADQCVVHPLTMVASCIIIHLVSVYVKLCIYQSFLRRSLHRGFGICHLVDESYPSWRPLMIRAHTWQVSVCAVTAT